MKIAIYEKNCFHSYRIGQWPSTSFLNIQQQNPQHQQGSNNLKEEDSPEEAILTIETGVGTNNPSREMTRTIQQRIVPSSTI
jgi:hypothetical protein